MWNKIFQRLWNWQWPKHVSKQSTTYDRIFPAGYSQHGKYLIPASLLACGITLSKCDSSPYCPTTFTGKCIPACAPKCTNADLDAIKSQKIKSSSSLTTVSAMDAENSSQCKTNEPEELTHAFLLKQASGLIVDAVTRLLTETVSAMDDYHLQYREMMGMLLSLLEEGRAASVVHLELLNCKMIVLRSQMEDVRKNLNEIEMFLSSVEALSNQAAQTAYLARAEYASIALSERLQSAMIAVNRIKAETRELENDLVQLQAVVIVESGKSLK